MLDDYNNKFSVFAFALESVMDDDSHYPYIIFPYGFSEKLFDDITMKSILEFCRMKEGDLPCLQNSLSRPLKPMEPQKKTVPTTHDIMVKESFFRSSIGHVFLIWLVVAFFLGALPGRDRIISNSDFNVDTSSLDNDTPILWVEKDGYS